MGEGGGRERWGELGGVREDIVREEGEMITVRAQVQCTSGGVGH